MTVQLELSEDKAEKLCDHLDMSAKQYGLMARDARKEGDRLAQSDFRAEEEVARDIRSEVQEALEEALGDE